MDKILLMLQLQADLNEATNGEKWTSGITKNSKVINWKRCIYMECAEMIESFTWKHWKNIDKEADWDNLQVEVVDVWHFIMSLAIENYSQTLRGQIEDLAINISELESFNKINTQNTTFAQQDDIIEKIESIMLDTLSKEPLNLEKLISDFFDLVVMSGLDLESLYKLYVGKNILNQFRQDHGYKEGNYIKIWAGEEDNVIMKRILEENSDIKPDELYKKLTKLYLALNKS
ncbi:dUTPase [Sulfurimonas sp. CVO]|jgi:dimeric dUTPase (all-alpha-NTP-PPase superfamily)|uniref:dUTPase n=1 Tax=Sulfurimonas xiamenensis TaxID=2590021 RepID=A0AAJ4A2V4_9BACT|nr:MULTISPECIES: dUTP diphosphatase [Sulfurimonas]QFR42755.1 dUTPase [Sulfurimonas xiamenensis]QHG91655.1 dUTPase [Sulfurimonas sp. CVO]